MWHFYAGGFMVFGILLFLILSSGSVLAAAYADRRYEEALPLTIFGIMAVFYFLDVYKRQPFRFLSVMVFLRE